MELNSDVRSLIVNDQMRLLSNLNLQLVHDSGERIKPLLTAVKACVEQEDCKSLALSETDRKFALEENDIYSWYMTKLESSFDEKTLERFLKRLTFDFSRFEMRRNTSVSVQEVGGKKILRLPVTGVDFGDTQKDLIRQSVEKVWNGDDLALQLEWLAPDPSIFRMIFDLNRPGERASVMFSEKLIEIFPMTSVRAVAHEFGHVLGFMDKYYTTFDQKTCSYVIEYNPGDIMSINSGKITPEEWKILKETYSGN
jgi:hypothetical protein